MLTSHANAAARRGQQERTLPEEAGEQGGDQGQDEVG